MPSLLILGRDHEGEDAVHAEACGERWAAAISAGHTPPTRSRHGNEDACGIAIERTGNAIAVVADAHWGALAAEAAVEAIAGEGRSPALSGAEEGHLEEALLRALGDASLRLGRERVDSEAAVIALAAREGRASWASIGDARAYLVPAANPRGAREITPITRSYFGASIDLDDARGLLERARSGSLALEPGDRLVLASDGLPECIYGVPTLSPGEIGAVAAGARTPLEAARALVEAALARGGEDNVAVVVGFF